MNSKGIELAASLIVILIACIVIFGLALGITYKIFCASNAKLEQLDAQTQSFVEQKLDSGANVAIPIASKTAVASASFCGASSSASASFPLGIRNDLTSAQQFYIKCIYKGKETADGGLETLGGTDCDLINIVKYDNAYNLGKEIQPKAKQTSLILISAPSTFEKGVHVFTIKVIYYPDSGAGPVETVYGAANIYLTIK